MDSIVIQRVSADAVVDLRHRILRAGLPRESAIFETDGHPTTVHVAAFASGQIVGCATVSAEPWLDGPAWRLRGMAVDTGLQRSGVGRRLLSAVDAAILGDGHARLLWCNARVPAIGFYERNGWRVEGEAFDIPTAGPHKKMTKRLDGAAR